MRLRVVMVIQRLRPYFSGQGVQVEGLCRHLARRGVEVTIVTAVRGRHPPVEEVDGYRVRRLRVDVPGLPFTARSTRIWGPIFALRTLAWLLRHGRGADVVHVHAMTDALHAARLFGRLRGVPVIFEMTLLGTDDPASVAASSNLLAGLRYRSYRGCDAFVAISPALAQRAREAGLDPGRLRVISQGVDTRRYRPADDPEAARARLDLPDDGPRIVFVGSLVRRKGVDVLLEAFGRVLEEVPQARLVLVGRDRFDEPGPGEWLAARLDGLDPATAARVHRLGLREDVAACLQACDLFAFPSRREGFGTVMIEAMACGLPCVVAGIPGITDVIFEGDAGVVVPQDDAAALAGAIVGLLDDADAAGELAGRGLRRAREVFSFERIVEAYLELYRGTGRPADGADGKGLGDEHA